MILTSITFPETDVSQCAGTLGLGQYISVTGWGVGGAVHINASQIMFVYRAGIEQAVWAVNLHQSRVLAGW